MNEVVEVLLLLSVTESSTVVVPTGKRSPEEWLTDMSPVPQASSASGAAHSTMAPHASRSVVIDTDIGTEVNSGSSVSVIVIAKLAIVELP